MTKGRPPGRPFGRLKAVNVSIRRPKATLRGPIATFRSPKATLRGPTTRFRGPTTRFRGPTTRFRGSKARFRGPKARFRGSKTRFRGSKARFRHPKATFRDPHAIIRDPNRTIRHPHATVRQSIATNIHWSRRLFIFRRVGATGWSPLRWSGTTAGRGDQPGGVDRSHHHGRPGCRRRPYDGREPRRAAAINRVGLFSMYLRMRSNSAASRITCS